MPIRLILQVSFKSFELAAILKTNTVRILQEEDTFFSKLFFPSFFTALAFDPLQKIMAIGNRSGKIRLYGRPGVDVEFQHQKEVAIFKIIFVVNTGRLLTATTGL